MPSLSPTERSVFCCFARQIEVWTRPARSLAADKLIIHFTIIGRDRCGPTRPCPGAGASAKSRMLHAMVEHAGVAAAMHFWRKLTACVWPSHCAQDARKRRRPQCGRRALQPCVDYPFFSAFVRSLFGLLAGSQWAESCDVYCMCRSCGTGMGPFECNSRVI